MYLRRSAVWHKRATETIAIIAISLGWKYFGLINEISDEFVHREMVLSVIKGGMKLFR